MKKAARIMVFLFIVLADSLPSVHAFLYELGFQNVTQTVKDTKLWVDFFDGTKDQWAKNGASPFLNAQDQPANYVYGMADEPGSRQGDMVGDFGFENHSQSGTIISVKLRVYGRANSLRPSQNYFSVYLWDGSVWHFVLDFKGARSYVWKEADVTSYLDTWDKINQAEIYLQTESKQQNRGGQACDAALLVVQY